ncbi:MAG: transcriptional regulator GcvA [Proteobacteria bacterium]|nr:transcriptional regulator GcvA [Pseudomonadota bacterium]
MARKLPPLNALRAFEAAARHLSVTRAAGELNVTPAAVSHQVKALEDRLGVALFRRLNRAMLLTDAGQLLLPGLRDGFDRLAEAVHRVRAHGAGNALTVSVAPSFAAKWLVPRLDRFRAAHADIEIRLDATDQLVDFAREDVDVAIRYGAGDYPGLRADRLFTDEVFPVCSPRLLEAPHPLREPADLRWHTLLHVGWATDSEFWPDWRMWLLAAGVRDVAPTQGPKFKQEGMVVQAALEGHGVALASSVLVADDLAAGRLVRPFELGLPLSFAYYVVATEAAADQPKVAAFRAWILAEAKRQPASRPG